MIIVDYRVHSFSLAMISLRHFAWGPGKANHRQHWPARPLLYSDQSSAGQNFFWGHTADEGFYSKQLGFHNKNHDLNTHVLKRRVPYPDPLVGQLRSHKMQNFIVGEAL